MKLVAVVRAPARPDEAARSLAAATGLTLAETRMRLAPEPPVLVARLETEPAGALVTALRGAGLAAVAIDAHVPSDRDRTVARSFRFSPSGPTFVPRTGEPVGLSWPDVVALLRGQRSSRTVVDRTEKTKRFSVATAVATGGLSLSRTSTRTERSSSESTEQVLLVYARDGRTIVLAETQVDFASLGAGMQASSTANVAELARRLREGAPGAFYDERLLRLGRRPPPFLGGGISRSTTATTTATHTDTSGSLDVLAEVLRQAVAEALLP